MESKLTNGEIFVTAHKKGELPILYSRTHNGGNIAYVTKAGQAMVYHSETNPKAYVAYKSTMENYSPFDRNNPSNMEEYAAFLSETTTTIHRDNNGDTLMELPTT